MYHRYFMRKSHIAAACLVLGAVGCGGKGGDGGVGSIGSTDPSGSTGSTEPAGSSGTGVGATGATGTNETDGATDTISTDQLNIALSATGCASGSFVTQVQNNDSKPAACSVDVFNTKAKIGYNGFNNAVVGGGAVSSIIVTGACASPSDRVYVGIICWNQNGQSMFTGICTCP